MDCSRQWSIVNKNSLNWLHTVTQACFFLPYPVSVLWRHAGEGRGQAGAEVCHCWHRRWRMPGQFSSVSVIGSASVVWTVCLEAFQVVACDLCRGPRQALCLLFVLQVWNYWAEHVLLLCISHKSFVLSQWCHRSIAAVPSLLTLLLNGSSQTEIDYSKVGRSVHVKSLNLEFFQIQNCCSWKNFLCILH